LKLSAWISALRLRTLPLALSTVGAGSFLALQHDKFTWPIFSWTIATTVFLQILSNLANDYGDSQHGADSQHRVGPTRAVQSGVISSAEMKVGVIVLALLSFISGVQLLNVAFGFGSKLFYIFLVIGVLSIIAAYTYTAGKRPYGYAGFGDLMVLIFFGLVGVAGTYYLFNPQFEILIVLPALSLGLLATAVLNINNMRDLNSDRLAGKVTIPVRLGLARAKNYHALLLSAAIILAAIYILLSGVKITSLIFVMAWPMVLLNLYKVKGTEMPAELDPYLKQLAISTFFFMLFFGLAIVL
jgi:1,4-dihydroxy-2-naphthoate octaprenyltransferase